MSITYGFLDESPALSDKDLFFCVDILLNDEKTNKNLLGIIKKARKKIIKKKFKTVPEIKFHNSDDKTRVFVLSELAKQNISIIILVVDKDGRQVEDSPRNYGIVVGTAVAESLKLNLSLSLTVDKKYTNREQQNEFIQASQEAINSLIKGEKTVFFNPPAESKRDTIIQLADFVAGAFNSKYNQKDNHYADLIKSKVKKEIVMKWVEIKRRIVKP